MKPLTEYPYIKAFRWASDRIAANSDGGIVAFISNGSWLDGNAQDGFRACLESEFSDIYVLNLRGNQRTSGELSRKEGGKIFGGGSRTPITITFLIKNPAKAGQPATIHYHDIGDYLTREQKLDLVKKFKSVHGRSIEWQIIEPTDRHDWINQRDGAFDSLIALGDKEDETQASLFDDDTSEDKFIRRDGITDWILKEVRKRFGNSKAITKEHIFYYVYGILHSPQYRERFAADLKKSLPRIPIVDNVQDFMAFYKAGKALAELHLNYEQVPPSPDIVSKIADAVYEEPSDDNPFAYTQYSHFYVDKMTFPKVRNEAGKLVPDKSCIIYNGNITIENIPAKAYEYIVNGKSAIEWILST